MANGLTTADYALIVSIFALTITIGNFVWNVWSKFIFPKPHLEVGIFIMTALTLGDNSTPKAICMSAVNHGPGEVELTTSIGRVRRKKFWKKPMGAVFKSYNNWPFDMDSFTLGGYNLPQRLSVGQRYQMFLRPSPNNYADLTKFGFADTFGRNHWASTSSVRRLTKDLKQTKLP